MNTPEIKKMCTEIYRDYCGMCRPKRKEDVDILALIFRLYNTTEIDFEEVRWLWMHYLEEGNLRVAEAIQNARERIADAEDIRETEEELIAWLHKGI